MAIRTLNQWDITHMNGEQESILAENIFEALENLKTPVSVSDVRELKATMSKARAFLKDIPDISWTVEISPSGASSSGCQAYPMSGTTAAGDSIKVLASPSETYKFDHWERNNVTVSSDKLLDVTATPPSTGEATVIYKAVFLAVTEGA